MRDLPPRRDAADPDADLERSLVDFGRHLDYPPTPDLSGVVRHRLEAPPSRSQAWRAWLPSRRSLAWVALLLVLLVGGVLLLPDGTRRLIAQRLGLPGITITRLDGPSGRSFGREPTDSAGERLGLGTRVETLADAEAGVSFRVFRVTLPEAGEPDAIYLAARPPGGHVAQVYRAWPGLLAANETGVGLLFTQFRGTLEPAFFGKGLPPGTRLEQLTVAGKPGYWIEGQPHFFFYRDQSGRQSDERFRLAANVLLWEQDGLTLRLEGAFSKAQTLRIAESIR